MEKGFKMNDGLGIFFDFIDEIIDMPDSSLTPESKELFKASIDAALPYDAREKFIQTQVESFYQQNLEKIKVMEIAESFRGLMSEILKDYGEISDDKMELINTVFDLVCGLIEESASRYRGIAKKIYFQKLHPSAQLPKYAHEEDACADVFAPETIIVPACARGFKVGTGICAAIPGGWEVQVRPRSGMSMKTSLRISNAPGTIDSGYLGEWCILFDNLSGSDYTINAGDRIAQVALKPVYYFEGEEVEDIHSLKTSDRGEGGFGSSGK